MNRALFALALAVGITASPVAAQQIAPDAAGQDQPPPAPPPASELPPPVPRASSEAPPPFPHFPRAKPREHNPNYRRSAHAHQRSSGPSHHRRAAVHHATSHARTKAHHRATTHPHAKVHHQARQYFSKRTISQCHRMTYREIMHHKYCRTMIRQDLGAAEPQRHRAHHDSTHHRSSAHHRKAHRRRR